MQTVRSILQISNHGVRLTDEFGSSSGIALELMLGTAVRLEFDLRGDSGADGGELTVYPADAFDRHASYFALDSVNRNSNAPALLKYSGITLEHSASGHNILVVELENNATDKIISAISGQPSGNFRAEIGGLDAQGRTLFAWQFDLTIRSRVFIGDADETVTGDPAYYTAVQTRAMLDERSSEISSRLSSEISEKISNPLELQFSVDGINDWHEIQSDDDRFYRQRIANLDAQWGSVIAMLPGKKGDPGESGMPTAGGTFTGPVTFQNGINFPDGGQIRKSGSAGVPELLLATTNGTFSAFTYMVLTHNFFKLAAANGTSSTTLVGTPAGALTWKDFDITLGYPKYSAGTSTTANSYTASADGWVSAVRSASTNLLVKVGGKDVLSDVSSVMFPVKKGDVVTFFNTGTSTAASAKITFFPNR